MSEMESHVVFDLTAHPGFPTYGENRSELVLSGLDVKLTIFYDAPDSDGEAAVSFLFSGVSQVVSSSFPGIGNAAISVVDGSLTALVKASGSKLASEWTSYWLRSRAPTTCHYQIVLTEDNKKYDIIARDVAVNCGDA
jgi:hypothetical protein